MTCGELREEVENTGKGFLRFLIECYLYSIEYTSSNYRFKFIVAPGTGRYNSSLDNILKLDYCGKLLDFYSFVLINSVESF